MKRILSYFSVLIPLAFICLTSGAEPRILISTDPAGDEIRKTARDFLQKISDGDSAGAKALFSGPQDHEALLDAELRFIEHLDKLMRLMASKAGKKDFPDYPVAGGLLHSRIDDQLKLPIVVNGEFASVASRGVPDEGLDLQRVNGGWKVIHLTTHFRETSGPTKFYMEAADASDRVRSLIEAGKQENDAEFIAATKAMMDRMNAAWEPEDRDPSAKLLHQRDATTQPTADLARFAPLIGKPMRDPGIQAIVPSLPGLPRIHLHRAGLFINSYEAGISFSFGSPPIGELQSIHIYGAGDPEFSACTGKLPLDLTFGESRASVERNLGRPGAIYGVMSSTFDVGYPRLGLIIKYGRPSGKDPLNPVCFLTMFAPDIGSPAPAMQPVVRGPRLTFRLVVPTNGPDASAAELLPNPHDQKASAMIAVSRKVLIDESAIAEVSEPLLSPTGETVRAVTLKMTAEGAAKLERITAAHTGEQIAIILDGKLLMAPIIRGKISDQVSIDLGANGTDEGIRELVGKIKDVIYSLPANNDAK